MLHSTATLSSPHSSRRPSPTGSVGVNQHEVSVETLISWLVAAKRSLSSIHNVHRATTVLAEARSTVESTAALIARTKYLRRSLHSQLGVLRVVQGDLEGAAQSVKQEINATVKELERADQKLQDDIVLLTQTRIEPAFKLPSLLEGNGEEIPQEQKDTLHDFVDDQPVADLRQTAQDVHTGVQQARSDIDASIRSLEDDLQQVYETLSDRTATSSATKSDLRPASIPSQLRSLENHAHEMAQGLESLVQHFDSCASAIKHTEGGGAAIAKKFTAEGLPEGVDVETFQGPAESMSEEERSEMLRVLKADAEQVEDVVADIQERGVAMESQLDRIFMWRDSCETAHRDIAAGFKLLEKVGSQLPFHVQEITLFSSQWQQERLKIEDCIAGMEQLCEMYENFFSAYDGMIVEAARRRTVRKKMDKIVQDAQAQLDQLYAQDLEHREQFRTEQGEYLPSDIWHGLNILPTQYGLQKLGGEGLDSIPELPKDTVSNAIRRLKAAHGMHDSDGR